jgi:Zn-dependent protease
MLNNLDPPIIIARIVTLIVAFTVHEFAHAWAANQLGDDTPRLNGRLTLNPLAHLDPIGSLLLLLSGFGWAKPVPVNPYTLRRRTPAGMMLVAAAGPLSNLLLALTAAIPFQLGLFSPFVVRGAFLPSLPYLLTQFIFINLILLFFNMIPVFPLDGEKVAEYFLPPRGQDTLLQLRPYGPIILMALLFILPMAGFDIINWLVGWPAVQVYEILVL